MGFSLKPKHRDALLCSARKGQPCYYQVDFQDRRCHPEVRYLCDEIDWHLEKLKVKKKNNTVKLRYNKLGY